MAFALSDMKLASSAFQHHGKIPKKHSGEGEDVSPPVSWSNAPAKTKAFALICHDPDAPLVSPGSYGFVHWVLYNIPGSVTALPEDVKEYTRGTNDFNRQGYGGPMPPEGRCRNRPARGPDDVGAARENGAARDGNESSRRHLLAQLGLVHGRAR
jgi:hypothetical protein